MTNIEALDIGSLLAQIATSADNLEARNAQSESSNQAGQKMDSSGAHKHKDILEPRAIQSLGDLEEAKEYRTWKQRLKNALDQARPKHARKVMGRLESVREWDVNDVKLNSLEVEPREWITMHK